MDATPVSLLYCKQPLNKKGRPYFNDGKWSLPTQKQLIPRMKRRSLNPLKIKQIYDLKIKDQILMERHQKTEQPNSPHTPSKQSHSSQPSQYAKSEPRPRQFSFRVREKSFGNVLFKRMGDKARYGMQLMGKNNSSWMYA